MATTTRHPKLPTSGPEREALRQKGQFWTPDWVAQAMVSYAVGTEGTSVFDPAVGAGAFFRAAKSVSDATGRRLALEGTELDPAVLHEAWLNGLSDGDLAGVQVRDFVLDPPLGPFPAIVANPPYIRHHRLSSDVKARLKAFSIEFTGQTIDARAGYHIYFLLRGLQILAPNGRLAFIMPADTCEGVFSASLWRWITRHYRLEAVVTFSPVASPFPGVDTNPMIFMLRNDGPTECVSWARCTQAWTEELKSWILSGFDTAGDTLSVHRRSLDESLGTGLSRPPSVEALSGPTLGEFAKVQRGIATGANEFFHLTPAGARALDIPTEFLIPAVGRTRDVTGDQLTNAGIADLDRKGRPTLLFSPDGRPLDQFPDAVRRYLQHGAQSGINRRSLISQRNPWYKMEVRTVPPILFAYLGRRNTRFIRNLAGATPLTGFLCVYPHENDPEVVDKLWRVLQHLDTIANLALVGKSYGDGAIKVEPRALEALPLPLAVLEAVGLAPAARRANTQMSFNI